MFHTRLLVNERVYYFDALPSDARSVRTFHWKTIPKGSRETNYRCSYIIVLRSSEEAFCISCASFCVASSTWYLILEAPRRFLFCFTGWTFISNNGAKKQETCLFLALGITLLLLQNMISHFLRIVHIAFWYRSMLDFSLGPAALSIAVPSDQTKSMQKSFMCVVIRL